MVRLTPRATAALLLAAALLIGLAQAALLPPWEGFDETAHYSYIQQLAETGHWPRTGDPVSADVTDYLQSAPTTALLRPRWTYPEFAAAPPEAIEAARAAIHARPASPRAWRPGETANWESQHPPLYYLVMIPAYLASKSWSLAGQLLFMRGVSYLIAFAGLCMAAIMAWLEIENARMKQSMLFAVALWPLLFPMWFPEMARLGNDSLVVLLAAFAWLPARRLISAGGRLSDATVLGAVLGLGLLTKATFLPFAAVIVGVLGCRMLQSRGDVPARLRILAILLLLGVAAAICGWWYLQKFLETGSAIGSNDVAHMRSQGGLAAGLAKNATLFLIAKIPWILGISFLWGGTWSFVLPPLIAILPLGAMAIVFAVGYLMYWRTRRSALCDHASALTWAAMLASLSYHSFVLISTGRTGAPAWYLHAFAPVLAPAVAFGIMGTTAARPWRPIVSVLLHYPLVFLPIAFAVQAMVFSGCGMTKPSEAYYPLGSMVTCALRFDTLFSNLAVLDFPRLAWVLFVVGWVFALIGVIAAVGHLRNGDRSAAAA